MYTLRNLGTIQREALRFFANCNGWHSFDSHPATLRTMKSLEHRKMLTISWATRQAKITELGAWAASRN